MLEQRAILSNRQVRNLYRAPLDEFTDQRNALASKLKEQGDEEQAREVRALRRPTVAAWAVNQLAQRQASKINKLVRMVELISKEQSSAKVRKAMDARRDLVADLVEEAEDLLRAAGRNASAQTRDQISQTLTSATAVDELERLKRGTYSRALSGSGFDQAMRVLPRQKVSKAEQRLRKQLEEVSDELKRRKKERVKAKKDERRARRQLGDAEDSVESAERTVERLEKKQNRLKRKIG